MLYLGAKRSLLSAGKTLAQQVAALFAGGEQGAWYEPSLTNGTLFQDSAGTTPVTAVGQPVGLMLDKSGRGNSARQATAINRPVLHARVNLLTGTELQGGLASTTVRGGLISLSSFSGVESNAGAAFGYDGGVTATYAYNTTAIAMPNTTYTLSVYVRMDDGNGPPAFGSATTNSPLNDFYLIIGGSGSGVSVLSYVVTDLGGGLYQVTGTRTTGAADPNATNHGVLKNLLNSARTFKVTGYDLRVATASPVATRYQRVNTATDYDAVGFPMYLAFNGTNSWMSTAAIDFTGTAQMTVVAGVRKLSDAAVGVVAELSADIVSNAGSYSLRAPRAATPSFGWFSKGTLLADNGQITPYPAPFTATVAGVSNIVLDNCDARVNGGAWVTDTDDQGTGNFGNYPLYIGARAGTSLFFNGNLYGLVVRGALSSDPQIASSERFMAGKTGVTLV